jgi:hypothetical protein
MNNHVHTRVNTCDSLVLRDSSLNTGVLEGTLVNRGQIEDRLVNHCIIHCTCTVFKNRVVCYRFEGDSHIFHEVINRLMRRTAHKNETVKKWAVSPTTHKLNVLVLL